MSIAREYREQNGVPGSAVELTEYEECRGVTWSKQSTKNAEECHRVHGKDEEYQGVTERGTEQYSAPRVTESNADHSE